MSAKLSALVDMRVIYCGDNRDQIRSAVSEIYVRSEEHTSELQSQSNLVCRLLLEKKNRIERIFARVPPQSDEDKARPYQSISPRSVALVPPATHLKPLRFRSVTITASVFTDWDNS